MYTFKKNINGVLEYQNTTKEESWTFLIDGSIEIENDDMKK
jgi:hypothetical protein